MSERNHLLVALTPTLLLLLAMIAGVMKERSADQRARSLATEWMADHSSVENWQKTAADQAGEVSEAVHVLRKLELACRELDHRQVYFAPEDGNRQIDLIAPGERWELKPIFKDISTLAEPIVEDALDVYESLPAKMVSTRRLDSIKFMLILQFRVAVHEGDPESATLALQRMKRLADVQHNAGTAIHNDSIFHQIKQSLEIGFWEETDALQRLRDQVLSPPNLKPYSESRELSQRGMIAAGLSDQFGDKFNRVFQPFQAPIEVPGESKLYWIRRSQAAAELKAEVGSIERLRELSEIEHAANAWELLTIRGIPFQDVRSYAMPFGYFSGHEWEISQFAFDHRATLIGVAIKQFQLANGRWPSALTELASVGLTSKDWCYEPGHPFQYSHTEQSASVAVDHEFRHLVFPNETPKLNPNITESQRRINRELVKIR